MTPDDLLERLRDADPANDLSEADLDARGPVGQRLLARARPGDMPPVTAEPVAAPWRGRAQALVAIGGLAAVAVAVGVMAWGASAAFASWTPEPAELTPAQVAGRVGHCPDRFPEPGGGGSRLPPVLLDVRGVYSVVLHADDDLVVQCYLETTLDGDVLASTAAAGAAGAAPAPTGITTVSNGVTTWSFGPSGGGAVAVAFGRAGDAVTGLEVILDDGQVVTATVEGGWWALWTPGDAPLPDVAVVTLADGSRGPAPIRQPE